MAWNEATSSDVRAAERAINRFSKSSSILSLCMLGLALAQIFLGIMIWLAPRG